MEPTGRREAPPDDKLRECEPGWGDGRSTRAAFKGRDCHPTPPLLRTTLRVAGIASTLPSPGEGRNHADAVVTPPSTTMVWPVMKLEASEPR